MLPVIQVQVLFISTLRPFATRCKGHCDREPELKMMPFNSIHLKKIPSLQPNTHTQCIYIQTHQTRHQTQTLDALKKVIFAYLQRLHFML